MTHFRFIVDGNAVSLNAEATARLLDVLRDRVGTRGVREGCGEGECGSCTVLLDGDPVCACLVPVCQVEGREITTSMGLATPEGDDVVSARMLASGGVQCGACTPGIVVTAHALLRLEREPDRERVEDALAGNLCRCTGYERIIRALIDEGGGEPT